MNPVLFLSSLFTTFLFSLVAQASDYQIDSCQDLRGMTNDLSGTYTITSSLDCRNVDFPIPGTFTGQLNGEGHTISHFSSSVLAGGNAGLFERIEGATIEDIYFEDAYVSSNIATYRGLIAPFASNSTISDITVFGLNVYGLNAYGHDIQGSPASGGLVGQASNVEFRDIQMDKVRINWFSNTVDGIHYTESYLGGIVGHVLGGTVTLDTVTINNLYMSTGGDDNILCADQNACGRGGLIGGITSSSTVENLIRLATVKGTINTYLDEVNYNAGGLVGLIHPGSKGYIQNSYTNVDILNYSNTGKLKYAGGIIGRAPETNHQDDDIRLYHVYAIGFVETLGDKGGKGISGSKDKSSSRVFATRSYFDKETTGKEHSGDKGSHGLSTEDMMNPDTYSNWDSNTWCILEHSYPSLQYENNCAQ